MVRIAVVAILVTVAGCWNGGIGTGFQCGVGDTCPDGQSCVDGFCTTGEATPDAATHDASEGIDGGEESPVCGTMSLLQDDFEDGVLGGSIWWPWDDAPAATPAESDGAARIVITAGSADTWAGFDSQNRFDLRGGALEVDVAQTGGVVTVVEVRAWDGPRAQIYAEGGMIAAGVFSAANNGTRNEIPYVPANHRYWRLRADDTMLYWELSADRTSWTELYSEAHPFPVDHVRAVLSAGGQIASPSEARYAAVNAGVSGGSFCPTATLSDDFAAAPFDPTWESWTNSGCSIAESGGQLTISFSTGTGDSWCGITSRHIYSLVDSEYVIDASGVPGANELAIEMVVAEIGEDMTNVEIKREDDTLHVHQAIDGVDVDSLDIPYDETDHRFWKIRESGGRVYFETSPDGATWTAVDDIAPQFDLGAVELVIVAGHYNTGPGSPQTVTIDAVNP